MKAIEFVKSGGTVRFDGADYTPDRDDARLNGQLVRV